MLGDVSVTKDQSIFLNKKTWQLKGLAGPADGLTESGPEERHVLGARRLRALPLLHANMCGICVHSRIVLTGELVVESSVQCSNGARAMYLVSDIVKSACSPSETLFGSLVDLDQFALSQADDPEGSQVAQNLATIHPHSCVLFRFGKAFALAV